jgi:IclR family transcriptional regulator, KDG regulon repressor
MSEVKSLARGLQLLENLAESEEGLGVSDLARKYNVDKSSISRMMQTLEKYGFAERDKKGRKYILGPQVVRLSRMLLLKTPLRDTAKSYLKELVEQTGECAHLAILTQNQAMYIDQEESLSALRVATGIGTLAPLHCTALGKVFLTFSGAPINSSLNAYTIRTITNRTILEMQLDTVRKNGYAVDDEEYNEGVRCIAVPVYDFRGKCVAAVGISGPTSRLALERLYTYAQIVVGIGKKLSAKLSHDIETSNNHQWLVNSFHISICIPRSIAYLKVAMVSNMPLDNSVNGISPIILTNSERSTSLGKGN